MRDRWQARETPLIGPDHKLHFYSIQRYSICAGKFLGPYWTGSSNIFSAPCALIPSPGYVRDTVKWSAAHTQNSIYILMEYYLSTDDLALNLCALASG